MERPATHRWKPTICGLISSIAVVSAAGAIVIGSYKTVDVALIIIASGLIVANVSTIWLRDLMWRFLVFVLNVFCLGMFAYYLYRPEPDGRNRIFTLGLPYLD